MFFSTLLVYLAQLFSIFKFQRNNEHVVESKQPNFQLRHLHGHDGSRVVFSDVPKSANVLGQGETYSLKARRIKRHKPRSQESFARARWRSLYQGESVDLPWDEDEMDGPDVEDRETLLLLAKMTYNAYVEPKDADWYDLGEDWPNVRILLLVFV